MADVKKDPQLCFHKELDVNFKSLVTSVEQLVTTEDNKVLINDCKKVAIDFENVNVAITQHQINPYAWCDEEVELNSDGELTSMNTKESEIPLPDDVQQGSRLKDLIMISHKFKRIFDFNWNLDRICEIIRKNPELLLELNTETVSALVRVVTGTPRRRKKLGRIIDLIIEFATNIDPLELALIQGDMKAVETMLKSGAKLDRLQTNDFSPAEYIFWGKNINDRKKFLTLLLEYGLDVKFKNLSERNLLNIFLHHMILDDESTIQIVEILIKFGVPIDEEDAAGCSPLLYSTEQNKAALVSFLLKKGAKVDGGSDCSFVTPISIAIGNNNFIVVDMLLKNVTEVNAKLTDDHWTALHIACRFHRESTINFLIQKGADVSAENDYGDTPLSLLEWNETNKYDECIKVMMKGFAKLTFEDIDINQKDLSLIEENSLAQEHYKKCLDELNQMKSTKFYGAHSIYSVLKNSMKSRKLALLTKNKELSANYRKIISGFSYYKSDLRKILKQALELRKSLDVVESRLTYIFGDSLPYLVIKKLTSNLTTADVPI